MMWLQHVSGRLQCAHVWMREVISDRGFEAWRSEDIVASVTQPPHGAKR